MLKIKVNDSNEYDVGASGKLNGKLFECDWVKTDKNNYHAIYNNRSFNIEILEADFKSKIFIVKVNGEVLNVSAQDDYDQLLHSLGMDNVRTSKVSEVKAPMPGMVLEVMAKDGITVNKGDSLLILEAMKMENIIKSPGDGMVKQINIKRGDKVEKNQVLITFE